MINYVTADKMSELTGYTKKAIELKVERGVWRQGKVWVKGPDKRRLYSISGYNEWAESEAA